MKNLLLALCLLPLAALATTTAPSAGACTSAHPLATAACQQILQSGGNAFDAAAASSAMLAVAEPFGSGLGGGGFFLLHDASKDKDVFLDGRERGPLAATRDMYLNDPNKGIARRSLTGMLAAAVPHQAALIAHISQRYGHLPLATVLAPAIEAAGRGFAVDWRLAKEIARHAPRMDARMKAVFAPNNEPLREGALLVQADLAETLKRFAQNGADEFATGETAQRMLKSVRAEGGNWQAKDLAQIAVTEREPLVGYFRDMRVITAPPPSAGGAAILESLTLLEAAGLKDWRSEAGKHLVVESLRRVYRDRNAYFGDPDYVRVPLADILLRSHLLPMAASINERATPSASLPAPTAFKEGEQTTHFNVLDAQGNRVAGTQSLNIYFGAAVMAEGTGVVLNDTMDDFAADVNGSNAYGLAGSEANAVAAGKRPLSSMSPTFAEGPQGLLITGTPGGSRIPSMLLIALLQFSQNASAEAITAAKRIHHQWQPDAIQFEPDALSLEEQTALKARGHELMPLKDPYGNLSAIVARPDGSVQAAADPRWVGKAAVVPARAE